LEAIGRIQWPQGRAPAPIPLNPPPAPEAPLPRADYVAVTYTTDEANAMAVVLTPGYLAAAGNQLSGAAAANKLSGKTWYPYSHLLQTKYSSRLSQFPARQWLGKYFLTKIGTKTLLCFKSEIHLHQDGQGPFEDLLLQIMDETHAKLVITTGTSTAIGSKLKLGDVVIAATCVFDRRRESSDLNGQSDLNGKVVSSPAPTESPSFKLANEQLLAAIADNLSPARAETPRIYWTQEQLGQPDITVTTDSFTIDDARNSSGLQGLGAATDMDDGILGLACERRGKDAPAWLSIRNISVPQLTGSSPDNLRNAATSYARYGFWTTVESAIATWAVVDGYKLQ